MGPKNDEIQYFQYWIKVSSVVFNIKWQGITGGNQRRLGPQPPELLWCWRHTSGHSQPMDATAAGAKIGDHQLDGIGGFSESKTDPEAYLIHN